MTPLADGGFVTVCTDITALKDRENAIALAKDTPSPVAPKSDEADVSEKDGDKMDEDAERKKAAKAVKDTANAKGSAADEKQVSTAVCEANEVVIHAARVCLGEYEKHPIPSVVTGHLRAVPP